MQESTYKSAGSVHGCALFRQDELLMFVEDVGRHNAIDTIAGWMWLHGVDGADKIFYTTGRLTSEMVIKSAQMGVPIIVSRSGITQMGHELAQRLGLALFGRATNRHFICYSGFERFDSEPEPCAGAAASAVTPGRTAQAMRARSRRMRRPGAALDLGQHRLAPAEREQRFGDDEHRADQQADDVVDEGRLAALVPVADELDHPADDEEADAPGQPGAGAAAADAVRQRDQQRRRRRWWPRRAARSPRVRYQAATSANTTQAGVSASPATAKAGRASSTPTAKTIIGTPTKWLAMLRRSRW